jgi:hypothetical protein
MLQARCFGQEQPRFYTFKLDTEREPIYGLERVDRNQTVYVTEGAIDSLFLPNAIAVSSIANMDLEYVHKLPDSVLVIDNEPRSPETCKLIEKYIGKKYSICLLPDTCHFKDINQGIQSGKTSTELLQIIQQNTFSGLELELKYSDWRKCQTRIKNASVYTKTE